MLSAKLTWSITWLKHPIFPRKTIIRSYKHHLRRKQIMLLTRSRDTMSVLADFQEGNHNNSWPKIHESWNMESGTAENEETSGFILKYRRLQQLSVIFFLRLFFIVYNCPRVAQYCPTVSISPGVLIPY